MTVAFFTSSAKRILKPKKDNYDERLSVLGYLLLAVDNCSGGMEMRYKLEGAGKGSKSRVSDLKKWDENYSKIFGEKLKKARKEFEKETKALSKGRIF